MKLEWCLHYTEQTPVLTEIVRQQKDSPILFLANRAKHGLPLSIGQYGSNALVLYEDDLEKWMCTSSQLIVCGKNSTRDKWNKIIREEYYDIHDMLPRYGEKLICRHNNFKIESDNISLSNGLLGYCISSTDISKFNGKQFQMSFKPFLTNSPFINLTCDYEYFSSPSEIRNNYTNKYARGERFEYGYIITVHLSQAMEAANGIYIQDRMYPDMQAKLDYTAITRFKQGIIIAIPRPKNYINGYNF